MSYNPYLRMKPTYSNITSPNTTFSAPKIKQPAKPSAPKKAYSNSLKITLTLQVVCVEPIEKNMATMIL